MLRHLTTLIVFSMQVETVRNYDRMLLAARNLRVEREKEQTVVQQKLDQKNQVEPQSQI